ncbi:hypothetical protein V1504DRAFT_449260 [Lipomyces starkeyi]
MGVRSHVPLTMLLQAVDVGTLSRCVGLDTIRVFIWVLSFLAFGYATEEFDRASKSALQAFHMQTTSISELSLARCLVNINHDGGKC